MRHVGGTMWALCSGETHAVCAQVVGCGRNVCVSSCARSCAEGWLAAAGARAGEERSGSTCQVGLNNR